MMGDGNADFFYGARTRRASSAAASGASRSPCSPPPARQTDSSRRRRQSLARRPPAGLRASVLGVRLRDHRGEGDRDRCGGARRRGRDHDRAAGRRERPPRAQLPQRHHRARGGCDEAKSRGAPRRRCTSTSSTSTRRSGSASSRTGPCSCTRGCDDGVDNPTFRTQLYSTRGFCRRATVKIYFFCFCRKTQNRSTTVRRT